MNEAEFIDALHARMPRVPVTLTIILLCVLVYLVEAIAGHSLWTIPSNVLLSLGANFAPAVQSGEAWRLVASMFLHGSPLHIGLNMWALWQIGQLAERLYGRLGFVLIYLGAGLMGSLASDWWKAGTVSVGASGAIFGAGGALLAYVIVQRGAMPLTILRELRSGVLAFIGYSLIAGFVIPGIDNGAHIGGLLGGTLLGAGLARPVHEPLRAMWRHAQAWLAILFSVAVGAALWHTAPQVAKTYQQHIGFEQVAHDFGLRELGLEQQLQTIMAALKARQLSPHEAANQLNDELAVSWEKQVERLATEDVPLADVSRRQMLVEYAVLRRDAIRLLARGIETGQQQWLAAAESMRLKGDNLLLQSRLQDLTQKHP
ncbi:MAG TPA: rhomboid family intramembrane serine protease [Rhodocyclaceae bacterium]|nr:rhomboid family intramembrane serine protease [Rhodocyclaceae bacterium]